MPFVTDSLLRAVDEMRKLQGSVAFGWVVSQVTVIERRWYGGQIGAEGGYGDKPLVLPEYYEVMPVSTRQIFQSGGQYEMGDIRVGPITPKFLDQTLAPPYGPISGGFSEADLHPVPTTDDLEVLYSITGNHAGEYQFVALESWEPTGFHLVLRRRINKPVEP